VIPAAARNAAALSVRSHVKSSRRRPRRVSTAKVLLDVAFRVEHHPDAFIQHVSGTQTRFKIK